MDRTHQLIKLKIGTVRRLKQLKTEVGLNSLDALINTMIRITNEHHLTFKDTGWSVQPKSESPRGS